MMFKNEQEQEKVIETLTNELKSQLTCLMRVLKIAIVFQFIKLVRIFTFSQVY